MLWIGWLVPMSDLAGLIVHISGDGRSIESRMNKGCGLLSRPMKSRRDEGPSPEHWGECRWLAPCSMSKLGSARALKRLQGAAPEGARGPGMRRGWVANGHLGNAPPTQGTSRK